MSVSPVIVALDFPTAEQALGLARRLDPGRCRVKVGKELFAREGPDVVRALHDLGFDVFLDLKFHDIPNTVAGACRAAAEMGVWMLNVHAAGGRAMIAAAHDAVDAAPRRPLVIGVTVLTSMSEADLVETGQRGSMREAVSRLARLSAEGGLDGIVCSAADLDFVRSVVPDGFLRVTPGIRPTGADAGDQRRIATPAAALSSGASYLVIGRAITQASDPPAAFADIEAAIQAIR